MDPRRRTTLTAMAALLLGFITVPPATAAPTSVAAVLATLVVAPENTSAYDRAFFNHWTDADRDGCNTRAEVLKAESLVSTTQNDNCTILTGQWLSYYDGVTWTSASDVDIDHMVALSEAWDSGAHLWTAEQRESFANDLDWASTLVAVTDNVNQSKSDRDPAEWMPPLSSAHCRYVTEWVEVKYRWNLTVDTAERAALQSTLDTQCPGATAELPPKAGTPGGGTTPPPASSPVAPFAQMVTTQDVTGDSHGDVFTVDRNGRLHVWAGRGDGTLQPGVLDGTGWGSMTIYAPGDWTGDGRADLLARDRDGRLWVYPGNGAGKLSTRSLVGRGWSGYQIAGIGDMTSDGNADVLAVDTRGRLWLYPGTGTGLMKPRMYAGDRWGGYRLHAAGDMNHDGQGDALSIDSKGQLWFYAGQGNGTFAPRVKSGTGWGSFLMASGVDLTGDAIPDLLGRDSSGRLFLYAGTSPGVFGGRVLVGSGW